MQGKMRGLAALALALLLALPGIAFAMLPEANARSSTGETATAVAEPTVAGTVVDPDTTARWKHWAAGGGDESRLSTENVGRIWTDKTVKKATEDSGSDFETTLSAMSSTSDTTSTVVKPLDIVLVLDASGSMNDAMDAQDSTRRIDALKTAANSFIDTIAAQNADVDDAGEQHRVAIVKFAGEKNSQIGNEQYNAFYQGRRHAYNYSQQMTELMACNSSNANKLKAEVGDISPAGCTQTNFGLQIAEGISSGRPDAQKIVVLFTDGSPTSSNGFEGRVANEAVTAARKLKDAGTLIYAIGIFDGVNPNADPKGSGTSDTNRFMHAASSNYPGATGYASDKLGARAQDSDYYKSATNADELKKAFDDIGESITSGSGYPTEIKDGYKADKSGYITFDDELGDFMQVDDFTSVEIDGKSFAEAEKTSKGNTDTYEFSGEAKNLVITVERAGDDNPQQGDRVTVKIPASLIPLREYKVDRTAGTFVVEPVGSVSPIRVTYTSSVKDTARRNLFTPGEVEGLGEYIEGHRAQDGDNESVYFLANKWSGGELGDTTATFEPADTNSYYYFQKNTPIYTDEACTQRAKGKPGGAGIYYYKDSFIAQSADGKPVEAYEVVAFQGSMAASFDGAVIVDGDGYSFAKGTARLAYIDQLHTAKTEVGGNLTATAADVLNPQWNNVDAAKNATHVQSHLGNNGKISFSLERTPAALDTRAGFGLTKVLEGRDWTEEDHFTFNITLDQNKSSDPNGQNRTQGSVTVTKADLDESGAAAIDFGTITFTKAGTYVYRVSEVEGEAADAGMDYSKNVATVIVEVTIDAAGVLHATVKSVDNPTFTNTYTAETPADAALVISATKTLAGRDMADGEFAFGLGYAEEDEPFDTARNKGGKVAFAPIRYTTAAKVEDGGDLVSLPELVRAGHATHATTADGKRAWTIKYVAAEETGGLPAGVSAALGKLEITVTVIDNGDGTLAATPDYGELGDTFKNEYRTDAESIELEGAKKLKMADGLTSPDITGKFTFTVTGEDGAPLPERTSAINDANGNVDFGAITFTLDDLNRALGDGSEKREHTFTYTIAESGSVPGVTNDAKVTRTVRFTVADDGKGDLKVKRDPAADISFEFTNTYGVTPVESSVTDQIAATKKLTGRDLRAGEFEFELVEGKGDAAKVVATGRNAADGTIAMSPITYKKPGKHAYTLREAKGGTTSLGVSYSDAAYTVETIVTDNGDGTLGVKHALKGAETVLFENSYHIVPLETEVDFGLTKQLVGRDWADDENFDFEISAAEGSPEGTPLPPQTQVSVWGRDARDGKAAIRFGKIRFVAAGTYRYEIREVAGDLAGIAYDSHVATAEVVVTEDGQGNLTAAAPTVENGAFANSYETSLSYSAAGGLRITKVLNGRDMTDGQFTFTVTPGDAASAKALGLNAGASAFAAPAAADGATVAIDVLGGRDVTFTQDDAGKTFTYTVAEDGDAPSGYTYDKAVRTVTISIADNGDATLTATTTVSGGPEGERVYTYTTGKQAAASAVVPFANAYSASTDAPGGAAVTIAATKQLGGRALVDGEFTFHLAYTGTTVPLLTARNDAAGNVAFGSLSYDTDMLAGLVRGGHAAKGVTMDGKRQWTVGYVAYEDAALPAGVSAETSSFSVAVTVVDNGDGSLTATPSFGGDGPVFKNVYQADAVDVELSGTKVLAAAEGLTPPDITGKFTFTISSDDPSAPMPERTSATNEADGSVDFGKITFTLEDLNHASDESEGSQAQSAEGAEDVEGVKDLDGESADGATAESSAAETDGVESAAEHADGTDASVDEDPDGNSSADVSAENSTAAKPKIDVSLDFPVLETAAFTTDGSEAAVQASDETSESRIRSHTFTYKIKESGSVPGVTNDPKSERTVKFIVTDDGRGHLSVARDPAEGAAFTFTNTYGVEPVESSVTDQIVATKQLTGRDLREDEFEFELVEGTGGAAKAVATGRNAADGTITMSSITYREPGTHAYTLREVGGGSSRDGVTYTGATYTVVTTVVDNGDGTLSVKHEIEDADAAIFINAYQANPTTIKLGAVKVLEGRKLKEGEFSFKLIGDDGAERTAVNDKAGAVDFGEFAYDAAGTYVYTITEVAGTEAGMTYDACVYTATVAVTDDGRGDLVASVAYANGAAAVDGIVFRNAYVRPEDPKTPGKPGYPGTPGGSKGHEPRAVAAKFLAGLPTTGDARADALIVAVALAAAGVGFIYWSRRRS